MVNNVHFDWTVSAGTVISTCALVVSFVVAHVKNIERIARMETKVDLMYRAFERDARK